MNALRSSLSPGRLAGFSAWLLFYFDTALPISVRLALAVGILAYTSLRIAGDLIQQREIYCSKSIAFLVLGAIIFAVAQAVNSVTRGVELADGLPYLLIIASTLPISIFALIMRGDELMTSFQLVSAIFSLIVIGLSMVFYLDAELFFQIIASTDIDRGFFGAKKNVEGDEFANVYFPATLLLVPHCVYAISQRKWLFFFAGILALFVAPSRFGVSVVAIFAVIVLFSEKGSERFGSRKWRTLRRLVGATLALSISLALLYLLASFQLSDDGWSIRMTHLNAVIRSLEGDPAASIFGFGAGSTFYTEGFGAVTDNIEISQLELVRKYGVVGFLLISSAILFVLLRASRHRGAGVVYALVAYYVCAFSNPVLLTLGSVLLGAASVRTAQRMRRKYDY